MFNIPSSGSCDEYHLIFEPEDSREGDVPVTVKAFRADNTVVVEGTIHLYVSARPDKKS